MAAVVSSAACQDRVRDRGAERSPEGGTLALNSAAAGPAARLIGELEPGRPVLSIELIDPGREPRRLLRYVSGPSTRQRQRYQAIASNDIESGGHRAFSIHLADTEVWYTVEVLAAAGARLDCEIRFERANVIDLARYVAGDGSDLRRPLALRGYRYRFVIDRRGFAELPGLELPPHLDTDSDRDLVWQIVNDVARAGIPLPDEPVGVGARWIWDEEDRGRVNAVGRLTTELELIAMHGRRLELTFSRQFRTRPQLLELETSWFIGISRVQSAQRGRVVVDLGLLLPFEWKSKTEHRFEGARARLGEQTAVHVLVSGHETMSDL